MNDFLDKRFLELTLREAGFSRKRAKALISEDFVTAQREAGRPVLGINQREAEESLIKGSGYNHLNNLSKLKGKHHEYD